MEQTLKLHGNIESSDYIKHEPKRSLTPDQEFFLVLVRLRLRLLEEDLATRACISQSNLSRIIITWLDFSHAERFVICLFGHEDHM